MSLFSILNGSGYSASGSGTTARATTIERTLLAARTAAAAADATTGTSAGGVTISAAAKAAAAAQADNAKDFTALAKEVRATLDAQYAGGIAKDTPDLGGMSGRALAAVALNRTGAFSATERAAARQALHEQTRAGFVAATAIGGGIAALSAYSQQIVTQYDAMSDEEREARGWTTAFRASNADIVTKAAIPSLFDQLGE